MADSSSGLKQSVLPCLIGAIGSVAVAVIGVLPQLRRHDQQTIEAQQRSLESLKAHYGIEASSASEANAPWTISGKVRRAGLADSPGEFEVYLVPGNSHLARPGDDGRFSFDQVLPGSVFLIVRELGSNASGAARALITPGDRVGRLESHGTFVEFEVNHGPASVQARVAQTGEGETR